MNCEAGNKIKMEAKGVIEPDILYGLCETKQDIDSR